MKASVRPVRLDYYSSLESRAYTTKSSRNEESRSRFCKYAVYAFYASSLPYRTGTWVLHESANCLFLRRPATYLREELKIESLAPLL